MQKYTHTAKFGKDLSATPEEQATEGNGDRCSDPKLLELRKKNMINPEG